MKRADLENLYELSPLQQGMLFHSILEPESSMYLVQELFGFERELDVGALRAAWQDAVDRHGVLRTSFLWENLDKPLQVVHRRVTVPFKELDWQGVPAEEIEDRLEALKRADRVEDFDLSRPPLLRLTLVRLAGEEFRLLLTYHHILLDGWSVPLLLQEVVTHYSARASGKVADLVPVRPFSDFIEWLQTRDEAEAEAFWRAELAGFTEPIQLESGPTGGGEAGGRRPYRLAEATSRELRRVALRNSLTLNSVLQGAWAILLNRYSGKESVVFGATVSGRPPDIEGVEEMIGPFFNTVPVRARIPESGPVLPWLEQLQSRQAVARHFGYCQLVDVQGWSEVPRNRTLFESLLVFENAPVAPFFSRVVRRESDRMRIRNVESFGRINYPLTVCLEDDGESLTGTFYYDQRRFTSTAVDRAAKHFSQILKTFAERSDLRLERLQLLTAAERQQAVVEWNDTASGRRERTLHSGFEIQALRAPERIAVVDEDRCLSYRAIEDRANRLAARISTLGVGSGVRVGVALDRRPELIVALLAVLKTGAAYVPLDPTYPVERLTFMIRDADLGLLLLEDHHRQRFAVTDVAMMDPSAKSDEAEPFAPPARKRPIAPASLAYVIYTSGSTGRPKGAAIEHRSAASMVEWACKVNGEAALARVLATTSISFDCSIFEIFATLAGGGTIVMARSALDLAEMPMSGRVTLLSAVPSTLSTLLDSEAVPDSLISVHLGGETSRRDLVPSLFRATSVEQVIHLYGPTEDTTYSTAAKILPGHEGPLPIGLPIADKVLYVTGKTGQPVPCGLPGEILLGGVGLARGYLGRPALTADRFRPDPFASRAGARVYRSGDLGRRGVDGQVHFLGRIDHQVKIRGFRVELGEVEATLEREPAVGRAIAAVHSADSGGDKRLVAYVVGREGLEPDPEALRRLLRVHLPEHMVPASIAVLDAFPLLPNGKVDRRALPEPDAARGPGAGSGERLRGATEEVVASVWSDILEVDLPGSDADFFELGGHSLLATRVISRLRSTFNVELPLRTLFEESTVSRLAGAIDTLVRRDRGISRPPLVAGERGKHPPLSFSQERLWFLQRLAPQSPSYNCPTAVRLAGPIGIAAIADVLSELTARHEVLRTTFPEIDGEPRQRIAPPRRVFPGVIDLGRLPGEQALETTRRLASEEGRRPFDLERGPLLRTTLLRLAREEQVLLIGVHHIISDGWSVGIMASELSALWDAHRAGVSAALPELPVQYADYSEWQRRWLQGEVLEKQLAFWRSQLQGAPETLELPLDRPRPPIQSFRGADLPFEWDADVSAGLTDLARSSGATLFMALLAGFAATLQRLSGQDDVVIGSPIANREQRELEPLIGFFVNTLALRINLRGDPSFRDLLGRVRETALGAYAHQDLPFEKLVDELQPVRDLGRQPLFQVSLTVQAGSGTSEAAATAFDLLAVESGTAHFDLTLALAEREGRLGGSAQFNTDIFCRTTVDRWIRLMRRLLSAAVEAPDRAVRRLPVLASEERHQLIFEWNDTLRAIRLSQTVHGVFREVATRSPDATAIESAEGLLTYRELDERSDQWAGALAALGAGAESRVAILSKRSADLITAQLAILKIGGAYVPLEVGTPLPRRSAIVRLAGAKLVLTESGAEVAGEAVRVLTFAELERIGRESPRRDLPATEGGEALAYVMFTSGSTGEPKGVAIPHRAVLALVVGSDFSTVGPGDRVGMAANPAFDATTFEVWGALLRGAGVVCIEQESLLEPARLSEVLRARKVGSLFLTTALLHQIVEHAVEALDSLDEVLFGGETANVGRIARLLASRRFDRLVHVYGPTETTTFSSGVALGELSAEARSVPIGRPLSNTRIYIGDRRLRLAPAGVIGELVIGGPGLARGYLGRPGLAAAKLVPDPFSGEAGERIYRSGDLARLRADGLLEFIGRRDFQFKIRGHRVESAEIEAVLLEHRAVHEAVVVATPPSEGGVRLVAYYVPSDPPPGAGELFAYLGSRLPGYMVPAAYISLENLPLTPNGKVDRTALPSPTAPVERLASRSMGREDPVEEIVAGVWQEVLGVAELSRESDFFACGGHSLSATQVASRLSSAFEVPVPIRAVFENPTLGAVSSWVADALKQARGLSTPPIVPVGRDVVLPLSFAQQRLWFIHRLQPDSPVYSMPNPLHLRGRVDTGALAVALTELVRRHEALRTRFPVRGGIPVQVIDPPATWSPLVVDLRKVEANRAIFEAESLLKAEAARSFDLAEDPVFRATVVLVGEEDCILLATTHHIVFDGWSTRIFLDELLALYSAARRGEPCPLGPLPVQFADFAYWQRQWVEEEELGAQLAYWRTQLSGAPPVVDLPLDRPRPPIQTFRGASETATLSGAVVHRLRRFGRDHNATLFTVIATVLQNLLCRYSGQQDILIGTTVAGRTRIEIEPLIGYFVNTLVLRLDHRGAPSFEELVSRARSVVLEAYAHQDVPFEKLVEDLQPERSLSHTPLVQVLVVFLNRQRSRLEGSATGVEPLAGVEIDQLDCSTGTAKFDLSLFLAEDAEDMAVNMEYSTDLFDRTTVRRMLGHLERLLSSAVEAPQRAASELVMLARAERHQLLLEGAVRGPEAPRASGLLHQLFEEQALRTPQAIAAVFEDGELTYAELDGRANRLAHRLLEVGVALETPVGVCLERSLDLPVAILAILKAGGAYVPLEPSHPPLRLQQVASVAGLAAIVSERDLAEGVGFAGPVIRLDADREAIRLQPANRLGSRSHPEGLAYVLFTSGSTGEPKGVAIEHRSAVELIRWAREAFSAEELRVTLASTSIGFDISVFELFAPWSVGGRVLLAEDVLRMPRLAGRRGATLVNTVPSAIAELVRRRPLPASVGTVTLAGEPLSLEVVQAVYQVGSVRRVVNLYGPTEDTVFSTGCNIEPGATEVTIGRSVAGSVGYVARPASGEAGLLPRGVPGELLLGGEGLARCYLARPALTAEAFIPSPFAEKPGARLYRTGDLVRSLPDGSLAFLGRIDHQVKVRGFRIELGEIEAALASIEGVREAAARVVEVGADRRIVSYILPQPGEPPTRDGLRRALGDRLPEYMLPWRFELVDELPRTSSGKLDRKSLPEIGDDDRSGAEDLVAPRDWVELVVAQLWQRLLCIEKVGVHENFFDLGGHSLLAESVVGSLEERFGRRLSLGAFFQNPTVAQLAAYIRREGEPGEDPQVVELSGSERGPTVFMVHPTGGTIYGYLALARELADEFSMLGLQAPRLTGQAADPESLEDLAEYHLEQILKRHPEGPDLLIGWSFGGVVAFEIARRLAARERAVDRLFLLDSFVPDVGRDRPVVSEDDLLLAFASEIGVKGLQRENLPQAGTEEEREQRLGYLLQQAKEGRHVPADLASEVFERRFGLFRRHVEMLQRYVPQPYEGEVVLIRAREGPAARGAEDLGWRSLAADLQVVESAGDHRTMLELPNVQMLAELIRDQVGVRTA